MPARSTRICSLCRGSEAVCRSRSGTRHVAVRLDPTRLDDVRIVRLAELEDPRRQPGEGERGDGTGDRDQRFDRADVAQGLEAVAVEDEPCLLYTSDAADD